MSQQKKVAFLLHSLEGGGIQRVALNLLKEMVKRDDISLDLVVASASGSYLEQIPSEVRVIDLHTNISFRTKSLIRLVPAIANYLRQEKPDVLLSHLPYVNSLAVIAKLLSLIPVKLILIEHTFPYNKAIELESYAARNNQQKWQLLTTLMPIIMRRVYPLANEVVTVSQGMARELEQYLKLKPNSIQVIYNPVIDDSLYLKFNAPLEHPWFQPNQPPVFVAVGRLAAQKDYVTLLRAFAQFREQHPGRLLILGEGELRSQLENLVSELSLENDVYLPGFVSNPYAYMSRASALVLSSVWEGLPTVLIEAMSCGCQIISTKCPHGPDEILEQGKYGWIVPVQDATALSKAMKQALEIPKNPDHLKHRSQQFKAEQAVSAYLNLISLNSERI